jgi:hypothetical protein
MLETEVQDIVRKEKARVSFFHDDSIETIRERISEIADVHPDRLFCLVKVQRPKTYYLDDRRRWEWLFYRLSYRTPRIVRPVFHYYQTEYRSPPTNVEFSAYDLEEWMTYPAALNSIHSPEKVFSEIYVLGTEEPFSYILPFDYDSSLTNQIPQSMLPLIKRQSLLSSLFPDESKIEEFRFKAFDPSAEQVQSVYFPFLTSQSPERLSPDSIALLKNITDRLDRLLSLEKIPEPELTILRTRYYIPFVDTDLGEAVRTRFEQMFYGLTVSADTPYIGVLTSSGESMRHKFFVEDEKKKEPYLDIDWWNTWWTKSKPARSRHTLLLYRGSSQHSFDRIAITSSDIIVSTYRPEDNKEPLEKLQKDAHKWLESLDSIMPFLKKEDTELSRWELQDMNVLATYKKKLEQVDLRRSDCVSFLYDMSEARSSIFRLLRTDQSAQGFNASEVKILQLLKENPLLTDQDVQQNLDIPINTASRLLRSIKNKEQEDPSILNKSFRGLPTMQFGEHTILISSVHTLKLVVEYANLLRFILSDPSNKDLEDLCPKRVETGRTETGIPPPQKVEEDEALMKEYEGLFDYVSEEPPGKEEIPEQEDEIQEEEPEVFDIKSKRNLGQKYFINRIKKFDPQLFNDAEYPTRCEQKNQPILLNAEDLERISTTPYDPRNYSDSSRVLPLTDVEHTQGIAICPEFWCVRDEIPLQESDLLNEGGTQKCPECKGKIKENLEDTSRDFTVIRRDKSYLVPGWTKYKSEKYGKPLPCCFVKGKSDRPDIKRESDLKYYILTERKRLEPLSVAFLPDQLVKTLHINRLYGPDDDGLEITEGKRVSGGLWGFFRVGLGRPSKNLPIFFYEKTKDRPSIPRPSEPKGISIVMRCSFFPTWTKKSDSNLESIQDYLKEHKYSEDLAPFISGIDDDFHSGNLTQLQELEYTCIFLECDIFRVNMNKNTVGCMFQSPVSKPKSTAIVALELDGRVDILSFVTREGSVNKNTGYRTGSPDMVFKANLFHKYFTDYTKTYFELEKIRNQACATDIPSYSVALAAVNELKGEATPQLIQDPYGRVQAFYIPEELILPFRPAPVPFDSPVLKSGYSDNILLPDYYVMRDKLKIAEKYSSGYKWKEDLANIDGERTEIVLESGLRIPTQPDTDEGEDIADGEVTQTIQDKNTNENVLAFGGPDDELRQVYSDISYSSEVFDFLLFALSEDMKEKELDLRNVLKVSQPRKEDVRDLLQKWFDNTTRFADIKSADKFVKKVRKPCGQFLKNQCSGNVCGWDSSTSQCKVQVKQSLGEEKIFNRLLTTLVTNAKLRGMVLDGRSTPFFSTILYIELPHELILTDTDLRNLL